jgi:hypothetical protein
MGGDSLGRLPSNVPQRSRSFVADVLQVLVVWEEWVAWVQWVVIVSSDRTVVCRTSQANRPSSRWCLSFR